jgi:hypothetical protein
MRFTCISPAQNASRSAGQAAIVDACPSCPSIPHQQKPLQLPPDHLPIQLRLHPEKHLAAFALLDRAELLHQVLGGAVGVVVEQDGGAGFGGQLGVQEAGHPEAAIDQHQIGFHRAVPPGGVHVVAEAVAVAVGGGIAPVAEFAEIDRFDRDPFGLVGRGLAHLRDPSG